MSKREHLNENEQPSKGRIILGGSVLVAGQFFSVFVPAAVARFPSAPTAAAD